MSRRASLPGANELFRTTSSSAALAEASESDAKVVDKVTGFSRDDFNDMKFAADRFWDKMAILAEAGQLK